MCARVCQYKVWIDWPACLKLRMNCTTYESARDTAGVPFFYIWNMKLRYMSIIFTKNVVGQLEVNSTDWSDLARKKHITHWHLQVVHAITFLPCILGTSSSIHGGNTLLKSSVVFTVLRNIFRDCALKWDLAQLFQVSWKLLSFHFIRGSVPLKLIQSH